MSQILLGQDEFVGNWVAERVRDIKSLDDMRPFVAIGVVKNNKLQMGVIYNNYTQDDIMLSIASDDPSWARNRDVIRAIFAYPFNDIKVNRVSLICAKPNKRARKLAKGLGFKEEGCVRKMMNRETDGVIYGMLAEECRWLDG